MTIVPDPFPDPSLTGEERKPPEASQYEPLVEVNVDYVPIDVPADDVADDEAASDPPVED